MPAVLDNGHFPIERREVEKRIYGVERLRLTASASFLVIEYPTVLNMD